MEHLGDITKIDWFSVEPVDVVTGGSPCQDLSIAGGRKGIAGERSGLFMEQIKCVKELRQADVLRGRTGIAIRPRIMVWENVPGAFSSNKGNDFRAVLEETVKIVCEKAPDVPMPDGGWPKAGCLYDEMGRWSVAWRVHDAQFWGVPQRRKRIALVADFGGRCAPEILFERKGLSGDFEPGQTAGEGTAGGTGDGVANAVCAGLKHKAGAGAGSIGFVMAHGQANAEICEDLSPTLNCNHEQPIFVPAANRHDASVHCYDMTHANDVIRDCGYICPTLKARMGTGGNNCPLTLANTGFGRIIEPDIASTKCARQFKDSTDLCLKNRIVRRITPIECERLQGYPGGWTDIGEWTDTKGKKHKPADTPRYKALGNSIALPFWMWLLKRISAQYERDATLGSLFDGIGGFPLCWERINGKGSARWASEIEEFPIAVTKRRFAEYGYGANGD